MWNAGLDESQTGIKIAGRNINNLRYTDDITLMAKSEDELKSLLMRMKEENEKAGYYGIWAHHFMQIEGGKVEAVTDFVLLSFKITTDSDWSHEIKRFPWKKSYDILRVY